MAVPWTPQADKDAQEFVAVADVAMLVEVAWALKIREYDEKYVLTDRRHELALQPDRTRGGRPPGPAESSVPVSMPPVEMRNDGKAASCSEMRECVPGLQGRPNRPSP